jgi:hypothetical protein
MPNLLLISCFKHLLILKSIQQLKEFASDFIFILKAVDQLFSLNPIANNKIIMNDERSISAHSDIIFLGLPLFFIVCVFYYFLTEPSETNCPLLFRGMRLAISNLFS